MNINFDKFLILLFLSFLIVSCNKDDEDITPTDEPLETILQPETIIADIQQTENGVISIDDNQIVINTNFPQFSNVNAGSVLVGDESSHSEFGFAVKVLSVTDNGSTKSLVTEPATMIDIFKQADINSKGDFFTTSDTLQMRTFNNNPNTYFEFQIDRVLYDYDGNQNTTNDQIKIHGTAKFRVSKPEFQWRKKENVENVEKTKLLVYVEDLSEIEVKVGTQAEQKWIWPGMTYLIPLKFYIPAAIPVPVFLPTTVNVGSSAEININLGLDASFKSNGNVTVGFEYVNGIWTDLSSATFNPIYNNNSSTIGVNGSIAMFPFDVDTRVNPYYQESIEAKLGAKVGIINTLNINNQSLANNIDAKAFVYGGVGADFKKWLGVSTEYNFNTEIFSYNLLNQTIPFTIPTDGLLAYYPFNGNANDESGNGHNGTVSGDVTLTADRHGNLNSSYSFDGINDYIQLPYSNSLEPSIFSISLWLKPNSYNINEHSTIISSEHSGYSDCNHGKILRLDNTGKIHFIIDESSGCQDAIHAVSNTILQLDDWYYITATYDGSIMKLFINGILEIERSDVSYSKTGYAIRIGDTNYPYNNNKFEGYIDDIRIYNRTLNISEIQALYNE